MQIDLTTIFYFFKIFFLEAAYIAIVWIGYQIFSMLMYGEGNGNSMYTEANDIIYLIIVFVPPFIFNLIQANQKIKSIHHLIFFALLQITLVALCIDVIVEFNVFGKRL